MQPAFRPTYTVATKSLPRSGRTPVAVSILVKTGHRRAIRPKVATEIVFHEPRTAVARKQVNSNEQVVQTHELHTRSAHFV